MLRFLDFEKMKYREKRSKGVLQVGKLNTRARAIDFYTTQPWTTLCEEALKFKPTVDPLTRQEINSHPYATVWDRR